MDAELEVSDVKKLRQLEDAISGTPRSCFAVAMSPFNPLHKCTTGIKLWRVLPHMVERGGNQLAVREQAGKLGG